VNDFESEQLPKGAPGTARAKVAELQGLLARAQAERDTRDRRRLEMQDRLESQLDAERKEKAVLEEERAAARARVAHLEHTLAQAIRRLQLIDEKLAAADVPLGQADTRAAQAPLTS
jgi:chromosome segregation ATPase